MEQATFCTPEFFQTKITSPRSGAYWGVDQLQTRNQNIGIDDLNTKAYIFNVLSTVRIRLMSFAMTLTLASDNLLSCRFVVRGWTQGRRQQFVGSKTPSSIGGPQSAGGKGG
jgi:hypothetical protein